MQLILELRKREVFQNWFRLSLGTVFLTLALAACSGPKGLVGLENPDKPVAATPGVRLHDLFVATSRSISADPAIFFSGERSTTMAFAEVSASIPPTHKVGEIERPKTATPNPAKDFVLIDPALIGSEQEFISQLNSALADRPPDQRDILVFIHGYNYSLTNALLRSAQFVNDSGFQGVPILFSWASRGKVLDYDYDMNSALLARDNLARLFTLLDKTRASNYDLVAHSMGNLLLVETIRQLHDKRQFDQHTKLNTIVMASPDIDFDLFANTLAKLTPEEHRFYVLVSDQDRVLKYSRLLAGGVDRLGDSDAEDVAALGVIAIDLSEVHDPTSLHHDTFTASPEVVQLIGKQMNQNEDFGVSVPSALVDVFVDAKIAVFGK